MVEMKLWLVIAAAIALVLVAGVVAFFLGVKYRMKVAEAELGSAEEEAKRLISDAIKTAESKKKESLVEAKDEIYRMKSEADRELKERRSEVQRQEHRLQQKEENLDKKIDNLEKKEEALQRRQAEAEERLQEVEQIKKSQFEMLEKVSGFSKEQAKDYMLQMLENELTHEKALKITQFEQQLKEESDEKAREILSTAIQRCASDHVAEVTVSVVPLPNDEMDSMAREMIGQAIARCAADHSSEATVSVVPLPSDEMKGRIIGREGRNIRALETATGVDLIIDDTPEAITLSCHDPVKREIARLSLEKLIQDGRIHPTRIEETVEKARREVETKIKQDGERAVIETGVHHLHPELMRLLGRMRYRTSYGQNVLEHSIEVAKLAGSMAAELGLDPTLARRAGLLHDIGKSLTHEIEGSHVAIGVELAKKFKESPEVIHAIEAHHGDVEAKTVVACLVQAADAVSAARPGARRENLENYIKRLEKLESIATSFEGVEKSYAIQAGREIRIILKPEVISDDQMVIVAREIAKKIEEEMDYPGQIKVNVVRETRAVDYAK